MSPQISSIQYRAISLDTIPIEIEYETIVNLLKSCEYVIVEIFTIVCVMRSNMWSQIDGINTNNNIEI